MTNVASHNTAFTNYLLVQYVYGKHRGPKLLSRRVKQIPILFQGTMSPKLSQRTLGAVIIYGKLAIPPFFKLFLPQITTSTTWKQAGKACGGQRTNRENLVQVFNNK